MSDRKDKQSMTREEIEELLELQGWSKTDFASELGVREATIYNWLNGGHCGRPVTILLREWLIRSRLGLPRLLGGRRVKRQPVAAK